MTTTQAQRLGQLTDTERSAVVELVRKLRQRFDGQLEAALLYGSRARGEAQPGSDMDVVVVVAGTGQATRREIRYLAAEVWLEHGIYVSTRVWSLAHWRRLQQLDTLLYRNIRKDGIDLLSLR
jgi:predicted nucleotidyltransferase